MKILGYFLLIYFYWLFVFIVFACCLLCGICYLYIFSRRAWISSEVRYSSKSMYLSMIPFGVSSMMRLHTVDTNSRSCDDNKMLPLNVLSVLLKAWIDSRSRWLTGESSTITLALRSIMRAIIQRIFSPPDNTLARL